MSIDNVTDIEPRRQYVAAAAQDQFEYPFPIFAEGDLVVDLDGVIQALGTDYTVAGVGEDTGGNITLTDPLVGGEIVTIWRDTAIERTTDYSTGGPFTAARINDELDRIVIIEQELKALIQRAIRFPQNSTQGDAELSPIDTWRERFPFINADGELEPAAAMALTTLTQSIIGALLFQQTAQEIAAAVTPSSTIYQGHNPVPRRYGAVGNNNGTAGNGTDDTAAIATTRNANVGMPVDGGGLRYRVNSVLPASPVPAGFHLWNGDIVSDDMVTTQDEYGVTVFGYDALMSNTYIPEQHAASGGRFFASGNANCAFGRGALKANTTGRRQSAFGYRALLSNISGFYNSGFGSHTLENCTTGFENTAGGVQSLQGLTTGAGNSCWGVSAGNRITTGSHNTGVGELCLGALAASFAMTADYCTAMGYRALAFNETGTDNVAVGRDSLVSNVSGNNLTAVGANTLTNCTATSNCTAVGANALKIATGTQNTAIGVGAADALTTGIQGVYIGHDAGGAATTADESVYIGYRAGFIVSTGDQHTIVGSQAGATLTTGSNCVLVGRGADVSAAGASNQNAFGFGATCTTDNQVQVGNGSIGSFRCQVALTVVSDTRDKLRLEGEVPGLEFVRRMEIFLARWQKRDPEAKNPDFAFASLSAQNLAAIQDELGVDLGIVDATNPEQLCVTHERLFPVMAQSINELLLQVQSLRDEMAALRTQLRGA